MAEIRGVNKLLKKFAQLSKSVQGKVLAGAVQAGALEIETEAKKLAAFHTGTLRRSIHTEPTKSTPTMAEATVGTDVEYAVHVEFGTKPHIIEPKSKKALYWPGARHPVKRVRHPGTKPRAFLRPAFDTRKDAAVAAIREAVRRIILQVSK